MSSLLEFGQRALVSALALTHTTERAAHHRGVAPFLPRLFADRFTHLGGFPVEEFRRRLDGCRSFEDARWAGYWGGFADEQLTRADAALAQLGGPCAARLFTDAVPTALGELLAPAVTLLADRGPVADPGAAQRFCAENPGHADAATALDALIKALVYEFAAAWPGGSPARLRAYERSHRLCEVLVAALAPAMGVSVETLHIPVGGGERVRGMLVLPADAGAAPVPTVLVSNGLEGTIAEVLLPLLAQRELGLGMFVMEMPGTYSYTAPLSDAADGAYAAVLDHLAADPRVDPGRLGMLGFSFGAYWTARTAAIDPRLRVAVANGPLTHRSFGPGNAIGMPEIMVTALATTLGATGTADLSRRLAKLSLAQHYRRIDVPLLVINGARDTLADTRDSVDLAAGAPDAHLVLYADDDHCAMGHAEHWAALSARFLADHLGARTPAGSVR
ncbi:alpha/beta hydrolase family protein [Nocardia sp. NPDC055321]